MSRAPVGEVNVAVKMRAEKAAIGGEGNGGVILTELHLGRDAPVAVALILQLLAEDGEPLSKIVGALPELPDREGQAGPAARRRSTRCTRRCGRRSRTRRRTRRTGCG